MISFVATLQVFKLHEESRSLSPGCGGKAVAAIESPRLKGYASNVESCCSGFRPPGKALHAYRRLLLGERAAPSPTAYTGDRSDSAAPACKWWKTSGKVLAMGA